MNNKRSEVSGAVIRRLPRYYRCLLRLEEQGTVKISSRELARIMDLTASQIRQDLNCFGGFGQQGYGYSVSALKEEIARILGLDGRKKMILLGAVPVSLLALLFDFIFAKLEQAVTSEGLLPKRADSEPAQEGHPPPAGDRRGRVCRPGGGRHRGRPV